MTDGKDTFSPAQRDAEAAYAPASAPLGRHAAPAPVPEAASTPEAPGLDAEGALSSPFERFAAAAPTPLAEQQGAPVADTGLKIQAEPEGPSAAHFDLDAVAAAEQVLPPEGAASPEDTAEIDVDAVEAKLSDPGSTMSFAPVTEERIDTDSTFDAGTSTSLMWGARSDVGCVRSHNEDSYLVASPLFCVCDGMGGHAAGEVASSLAVETIAKMAPRAADPAMLGAAIEAANAAIIEAAANGLGKPGMGCTATAAYIEGASLAIAHVGDSRAYLLHEGTLIRVTRDHSYVEELVDAGEITADEARVHPNRSVITRALGSDPLMYADHFQLNIEEGDRLILCSDGLSSMIPDSEIEAIAVQSGTAQMCTDNLVDAALAAGGSDNTTVVVIDVVNDGRMRQLAQRHRRNALIALTGVLGFALISAIVMFFSIQGSIYLGVKDGCVAIYSGIPNPPLSLKLNWLQDETSVQIDDLPEDTQRRLREGIPQDSMDDAVATVENYRTQIDEKLSHQAEDAQIVRRSTDPAAREGADGAAPASSVGGGAPADSVAPSNPNAEGGAAQ